MTRWTLFSGMAVASYVVFQFGTGDLGTYEVIRTMEVEGDREAEEVVEEYQELEVPEEVEEADSLRILAFGDVMLGRYVRTLMDKNGHNYPFEKITPLEQIYLEDGEEPDLIFANLEGPIQGDGYEHPTAMRFGFPEYVGPLLKEQGFDVLSLANNHALDRGWEGRDRTIEVLEENELGWCGHPTLGDAESVYYAEKNGLKYAFLCFNDVIYQVDRESTVKLVEEVAPQVDLAIVSVHWGPEYQHRANQHMRDLAHRYIDAGADLIIGHHPHVVANLEYYNDRLILYSLGNFVFDQYWALNVQEELAAGIELKLNKEGEVETALELFPMKSENSQSRLMTEEEKKVWIEKFIGYGEYDEGNWEALKSLKIKF